MKFEETVIKYEPHGCEYTWYEEGNCLFTRYDDTEEWGEVDLDHCIAEGINHYEVYKHFGEEKWYVDYLFEFLQNEIRLLEEEIIDLRGNDER